MKKITFFTLVLISSHMFAKSYPLMRILQKDLPQNMVSVFPACGLGSHFFPDYSWISSAPASSTNVTSSSLAPTSTTMNASGCKGPKTLVDNHQEIFNYANENIERLARDVANGDGETLDALGELMSIPALDRDVWKQALQERFAIIFPTPDIATAYVLDQIAVSTHLADIDSPSTKNLSWREVIFGTF